MGARIEAIEYHLPTGRLSNEDLARDFPDWPAEKILEKTGIRERPIVADGECASDLAVGAASRLIERSGIRPEDVGYVILCTQSPDYLLPTTACLVQERLGLPTSTGAVDINLGCSGYVYGLGLAKGLLESGQTDSVLLLTADTYTKFIHRGDKSVRTLFGDAGTATFLRNDGVPGTSALDAFVYGTDGKGGPNLIVPTSGTRRPPSEESGREQRDDTGAVRSDDNLYMNGPEIFAFTMESVPRVVRKVLEKASCSLEQVDHVVFHQANKYMLEHLRKKLKIAPDRFVLSFQDFGNTVSSTIPIALKGLMTQGRLGPGQRTMLVGFGVGYSWAGAMLTT